MLGIKEWNLDSLMFAYLWSPFKWLGKQFRFLQSKIYHRGAYCYGHCLSGAWLCKSKN